MLLIRPLQFTDLFLQNGGRVYHVAMVFAETGLCDTARTWLKMS
jgi:hypothetical protein